MISIREKYLEKIKEDFEVLSTCVIKQIDNIMSIVDNNEEDEVYQTIEQNEIIIDGLEVKIRNKVINSIVLYSPKAVDCRKIMSYHDMTAYLERIGDLLLNIAYFLKDTDRKGDAFKNFNEILLQQLATVKKMTQNAIFAFVYEDEELAKQIIAEDIYVDERHFDLTNGLSNFFIGKVIDQQQMMDVLCLSSMSYNIERIGDNATNIAESAIYLLGGKDIKHIHNENI